jgi:phage shock protein C
MNTDKQLTRSSTDKQVGGVCGGLARYFGIDPVVTRVGFIATTLFTGGAGALAYLAMLVVMPSDKKTVEHHYDPLAAA